MGFGKYKNKNSADLVHRIELFDFETGDAAMAEGKRQQITILGQKSRRYQNHVEGEEAQKKRKKGAANNFSFEESQRVLARRLAAVVVSVYIDVGDDDPDIIDVPDISKLDSDERQIVRGKLRDTFAAISDLAIVVNEEVVKDSNFLPGRAKTLSDLLGSANTTEPSQKDTRKAD